MPDEAWGLKSENIVTSGLGRAPARDCLSLAHTRFTDGAYLIDNSDLPGFSLQEQKLLAMLVRGHRRKFRAPPCTCCRALRSAR